MKELKAWEGNEMPGTIVQRAYDFLYHNLAIINGKWEYNILKECYEVYGRYDYRDKIILDIGADFGLSPKFFIDHGAKKVIAYSPMRQKRQFMDPKIEWNRRYWKGEEINADFLKIDCEGCEYYKPIDFYLSYPEALIAIHDLKNKEFLKYSSTLWERGADLIYHVGNEYMFYWKRERII